jgi:signal transduction histidine kinase
LANQPKTLKKVSPKCRNFRGYPGRVFRRPTTTLQMARYAWIDTRRWRIRFPINTLISRTTHLKIGRSTFFITTTALRLAAVAGVSFAAWDAQALPCLTNTSQVHLLSTAEASRGYPVSLDGVVLYADPLAGDLVIQDATGSIYISGWPKHRNGLPEHFNSLKPGDSLHVIGTSFPGDYAPCVALKNLNITGTGTIRPAKPVSYEDLASGFEDGQWVEVHGIVHSAAISQVWTAFSNHYLIIVLSVGGDEQTIRVQDFAGADVNLLPDAEVRISGVSVPMFTTHRQLYDVVIMAPSLANVKIELPQPTNAFDCTVSPINSLLQFSPTRRLGHRVKVAGTVLLQRPGEVFIKDETQAICAFTAQTTSFVPGDRVEALGFPAHGNYSPELKDAVFHKIGSGLPPVPIPVSVEQACNGDHNDDVVQMDGQLLNFFRYVQEEILVLQQSNFVFNVHLPDNEQTRKLETLSKGSLLRVTGVCEIQLDNWRQSFQLLSQSPSDVVVLRPPEWWNLRHAAFLLAGVTIAFGAVLGAVVGQSRRRINAHLREWRQAEAQFAAVNNERNRLAGELHDSLEQSLVGIGMQLDAGLKTVPSTPQTAMQHLELAQQMVDQSQKEVRRSIWDLRSQMLDNNDLPGALDAVGKQLSSGTDIHISVEVLGARRRLPEMIENHLLRISQEAVANAIKHGRPRRIELQLVFEPASVALMVRDDGHGFEPNKKPTVRNGHFGLAGMHERAKALNGTVEVESRPGKGTVIIVEVPVKERFPEEKS